MNIPTCHGNWWGVAWAPPTMWGAAALGPILPHSSVRFNQNHCHTKALEKLNLVCWLGFRLVQTFINDTAGPQKMLITSKRVKSDPQKIFISLLLPRLDLNP